MTLAAAWTARGVRLAEHLPAPSSVGALVALVPAALTGMFVGEVQEGIRRFDDIAAVAERTGDRELAAQAAFGRGKCLTTIGRTSEGFASLDGAMDAVAAGDASPLTVCLAYRSVLDVWHEAFDLVRAERWTSAFAEWCGAQPELVAYSGQAHAYRAQLLLLRGEWAEASAAANLADESLRAGDFTAGYVANYQLAELHRLRGENRAAEERYRRAARDGVGSAARPCAPPPRDRRARGRPDDDPQQRRRCRRGGPAPAAAGAGDHRGRGRRPGRRTPCGGRTDVAGRSAPTPMLWAVSRFAEAQTLLAEGDAAGALESVGSALDTWSVLEAPYEAARCRLLRGRILGALGRARCRARGTRVGGRGVPPARRAPRPRGGAALTGERAPTTLTAREGEVLRLVATGLTNRGIAGRLSLSEKTVARHLSNIFGKLGLSSRSAATAYAYEHGLI